MFYRISLALIILAAPYMAADSELEVMIGWPDCIRRFLSNGSMFLTKVRVSLWASDLLTIDCLVCAIYEAFSA